MLIRQHSLPCTDFSSLEVRPDTAVFVSGKALAAGAVGELPAASALRLTNVVATRQTPRDPQGRRYRIAGQLYEYFAVSQVLSPDLRSGSESGQAQMNPGIAHSGSAVRHRRFRRVIRAGLFAATLIGAIWGLGGFSALFHRSIAAAFTVRNYEKAERLIELTRQFRCQTSETTFWEARLRRKQLQVSKVPDLLVAARDAGYDPERIRLEYLLLEAQTGRIKEVANELNSLLRQSSEDGAEICEAYVNGAMMVGATDIAMTILPVWRTEFPQNPQPHYALARILEYQQDIPGALSQLKQAVDKSPNHWPSRYARGRILFGENRFEEALTDLQHASAMQENAAPLYQQARCLRSLSQLDEAHRILSELLQRDEEAIRTSFDAVGEPMHGRPLEYELGSLEAAMGNHESARRWLEIVLAEDPNHLDARYARALSLRELGKSDEAEAELAEVQKIRTLLQEIDRLVDEINRSPDEPHLEARCRVGELFMKYENARHGEFWVQEALNRDPNYKPAHALLADYYAKLAVKEPGYSKLAEEHRKAAQPAEPGVGP